MKKNIGSLDKVLRILVGILIGAFGLYFKSWWGLLGLIPLFTAMINFCPLYKPFGISTCKKK